MACLQTTDKIFVAGGSGLVGSAIVAQLQSKGYANILTPSHKELNLENQSEVESYFAKEKPDVVFIAAAKVGGIHANNTFRADFIYKNMQIQNNVIWSAHQHNSKRLIFLGSSCIYPKQCSQPMQETALLTGELEYTNRPYAVAKIAGLKLVQALRTQYKRDYFSVMPTNLYGPGDNFHPEESHVLPALIRRFYEAKKQNTPEVVVWGSGKPLREFMYSQDCASAIVFLAENLSEQQLQESAIGKAHWSHVNVGTGQEVSIAELAKLIAKVVGYAGTVTFDSSKPDGTLRKLLDCSLLHQWGWKPQTTLEQGIQQTLDWFEKEVA